MKVFGLLLIVASLFAEPLAAVPAKDSWISLRSRNYRLVGNARELDVRLIAKQLEQFREVFVREFQGAALSSPIATTVIVFKSKSSYNSYKPLFKGRPADVAGFFQAGYDVNYISLSAERRLDHPYAMIFHESVHLLVNNRIRNAPGWFNEGLAEYFSTFELLPEVKTAPNPRIMLGKPIPRYILMLRQNKMLPLATLFAVDRSSPYYNEREKSSVFYAQSWALIHYLAHGNSGQRQPQVARFLDLLAAGDPVAQSFQTAFQTDYSTIERELKDYVRQDTYRVRLVPYAPAGDDVELKSTQLTEAEALSYLGDMLLHIDRVEEADKHLRQAIELAPELSMAQASFGMVCLRQGRFADATNHLQQAMKADPRNYLAHFYYAYALSRNGMDDGSVVTGYSAATAEQMRASLRKAIDLAPDFPESYRLLAFVNLATNTRLDEALDLLKRGLQLSPGRHDYGYVLAQVHLRRKEYNLARAALEQIIAGSSSPSLRALALKMFDEVALTEKYQPKQ